MTREEMLLRMDPELRDVYNTYQNGAIESYDMLKMIRAYMESTYRSSPNV